MSSTNATNTDNATNTAPISITEIRSRRTTRATTQRTPLTAGQRKAYRQLALTVLGLDVTTLTSELRARREQAALLNLVSDADRAA
jgi:hypothetical protein